MTQVDKVKDRMKKKEILAPSWWETINTTTATSDIGICRVYAYKK